jgi:sigma 54 modulation/S30EA-like ribosomal protein
MTLMPTQITFHGVDRSEALEADIRERVTWLEQFYAGVVRCRVLVEKPHRWLELTVPGGEPIVVSHEPSLQDD